MAEHLAALRELAPVAEALVEQVIRLDEVYADIKAARGLIDFADIEHMCLRLLGDEDVAEPIRSRFDEVLVDECQDLNGVQDEILKRVTRPPIRRRRAVSRRRRQTEHIPFSPSRSGLVSGAISAGVAGRGRAGTAHRSA